MILLYIYFDIGPDLQHNYNLTNGGKDCYDECDEKHGPCDFCGGGLCCQKGLVGNGCDGFIGEHFYHTCVLPCNIFCQSTLLYEYKFVL